jgi:hypothetical protein
MPSGHGALAQQTPQPLHGAPGAGFGGAALCNQMVRALTDALCPHDRCGVRPKCATFARRLVSVVLVRGATVPT